MLKYSYSVSTNRRIRNFLKHFILALGEGNAKDFFTYIAS